MIVPAENHDMKKPNVLVFSGYGLNCEEETKVAFEMAGAKADIVHINDLIAKPSILKNYQIASIPGGFAYGDDTGAGKAYGNRVKQHLSKELEAFLSRDTLMIAICNGFQVATSAGILPGALIANDSARYICRWVDLEVKSSSPWLKGISRLSVPIAHGEGKYFADKKTLESLKKNGALALRYTKGEISKHFDLPANPNGALMDIAGVTARDGRVLGLMPHPERGVRFTQLPHWTYLKEQYVRAGKKLPADGPGIQIFKNAVKYFR
ncbi:MAG: Phosphoribosylformylglycinamidine synthase 1 [Parcubacteria group bacterium Gr01-1014_8]|nr:MAG: Phosphoribosylformylglycinamidine synthase 1 [Parcubacteria group bacterium Gr01-1014_8]